MRAIYKKFGFKLIIVFAIAMVFVLPNTAKAIFNPLNPIDVAGSLITWLLETIVNFIGWFVITTAASLVNYVFQFQSFTKVAVVQIGWTMSRDLANMGFILIMLAMAFGTILRIDTYGWKKLLPKLVMVALLINFSLIIAGVFIDIGNSLGLFFVSGGTSSEGANVGDFIMTAMHAGTFAQLRNDVGSFGEGVTTMIMATVVQLIFYLIMAFLLLALAFIMIFRMINLWILLILAPLAWISYALPKFGSYWGKWWSSFLNWAFFPAVMGFFIFLGLLTGASFQGSSFGGPDVGGFWSWIFPETMFASVMQFIVVVAILFMGLIQAGKLSGAGTKTMMGAISSAQKWSVGKLKAAPKATGKFVAGTTDRLAGGRISRRIATLREGLEGKPLIGRAIGGPGTRFAAQQKALKESTAKFAKLRPNDIEARLKQAALTPQGLADRAGMIQALVDKGQFTLHEKPEFKDSWMNMLQTFQNKGGNITDLLKKQPTLMNNPNIQGMIMRDVNTPQPIKNKWQEVIDAKNPDEKKRLINKIRREDIIKNASDLANVQKESTDRKGKLSEKDGKAFDALEEQKKALKEDRELKAKEHAEHVRELQSDIAAAKNRGENTKALQDKLTAARNEENTHIQKYATNIKKLDADQIKISGRTDQQEFLEFLTEEFKKNGSMYGGALSSLQNKDKAGYINVLRHLQTQAPAIKEDLKEDVYRHITSGVAANTIIDSTATPSPTPTPAP